MVASMVLALAALSAGAQAASAPDETISSLEKNGPAGDQSTSPNSISTERRRDEFSARPYGPVRVGLRIADPGRDSRRTDHDRCGINSGDAQRVIDNRHG